MLVFPGRRQTASRRACRSAAALLLTGSLVAGCGGGGDGGSGFAGGTNAVAPPPATELAVKPAAQPTSDGAIDCSVTLEGDSIMYGGYGGNLRLAEPPAAALMRMRPAYRVVDNAMSGTTAGQRAPAFVTMPLTTRLVVLEHGINDALFGQMLAPPLRSMVDHVKAQGRVPIITGLSRQTWPMPGRDAADAIAKGVAQETGALFADWGSVPFTPDEMADVLHPGQAYSTRLVARIVSLLDMAAPECAS